MMKHIAILALALATASASAGTETTCPSDYSVHHLLPHESDCSKFYYCENGQKREDATDCDPGTLFSYQLQVCDLAENVNCANSDSESGNGSGSGSDNDSGTGSENRCDVCNAQSWVDPDNCSRFYRCIGSFEIRDQCSNGLVFNEFRQVCDYPEQVAGQTCKPCADCGF